MNIFFLDYDIRKCAQYHCDKHVIKMILEYAQILCTSFRSVILSISSMKIFEDIEIYRSTHIKHPCVLWAMSSFKHWFYLWSLCALLDREYLYRYKSNISCAEFDDFVDNWDFDIINGNFLSNLNDFDVQRNLIANLSLNYNDSHKSFCVVARLANKIVSSEDIFMLFISSFQNVEFVHPPQAMPDIYRSDDCVESYRLYYKMDKVSFAKWINRDIPKWMD
ncbi:hypothetical protein [Candidatus Gromoviella agglomerans]|uniref:hypothetical protein n=1 Tax=Candidatus Gromoviella agglomerans TaxID=2806609 RepID=UPI001E4F27FE|nr:hypothetical protein [Candidatus Gromoviella agglomerans]UFX98297.1 hypothetical protein Gromo_00183 [Candidatus Gromoviella agglomerans]